MENNTEGWFHSDSEPEEGTTPEVEGIYESIQALSATRKAQLLKKLARTMTTEEIGQVLKEFAYKLRDVGW